MIFQNNPPGGSKPLGGYDIYLCKSTKRELYGIYFAWIYNDYWYFAIEYNVRYRGKLKNPRAL